MIFREVEDREYMIGAGFVDGCFGLEEDMVHDSVNEITKASNFEECKRCSYKEIPQDVLKAASKTGIGVEKLGEIIPFGRLGRKDGLKRRRRGVTHLGRGICLGSEPHAGCKFMQPRAGGEP